MKVCKHFCEVRNGNLIYCNHFGNKDDHEGNCQPDSCPLGIEYFNMAKKASEALGYIEKAPYICDQKEIKKRDKIMEDLKS